jgi:hypothetical protein
MKVNLNETFNVIPQECQSFGTRTRGTMGDWSRVFITSALEEDENTASRYNRFDPRERDPGAYLL